MDPDIVLIDTAEGLARLVQALKGAGRVALDTEADSMHHYFEKVCLIQVSFGGMHYIVDPLAGLSLTEFFEVLAGKPLILHASDNDLRILKRDFGFRPSAPVFDTLLAAQVLGFEKIGLAALVEKFFNVVLSKSAQRSDWSLRPLPAKLLNYAAGDTKYLEPMADMLQKSLEELGRADWHREYCERVVKNLDTLEKAAADPENDWRVKGSSKLQPEELVFVRELWKWRDTEARRKDRPAFMILRNEDLIELALWQSKNRQAPLSEGPVFVKRFKDELRSKLEGALKTALNTPPAQWPARSPKREWFKVRVDEDKLETLSAFCKKAAEGLKIQPFILAPQAVLETLVEKKPRSVADMMQIGMMRWQAELLLPAVQKI